MYDILFVEQTQTFDNRVAEASDQTHAEAIIVVLLDQLVQIETAKTGRSIKNMTQQRKPNQLFTLVKYLGSGISKNKKKKTRKGRQANAGRLKPTVLSPQQR